MFSEIPFTIPSQYMSGLADGSIMRIGTLLKDSGSGKILAHVQETGVGQQLLSQLGGSPFSPLSSVNAVSSGYANVQLSQLQSMVESLQLLQFANLGISMAGIGVSVIGFAIVNNRLKGIDQSLAALAHKVDQHFRDQYERELRRCFSAISALFEKADIARSLSAPRAEYLSIASALADQSGILRGELAHRLSLECFDAHLVTLLTRPLLLCNAARIEALLLADEPNAAHDTANLIAKSYTELFDDLSPYHLSQKLNKETDSSESVSHVDRRRQQLDMQDLVEGIRDVTDAALTKPFLIETLIEQGISGRDFISSLRNEKEQPVLLLRSHI